jgi:hypothetical protein
MTAGIRASSNTTVLVATDGRTAIRPKTTARMNMVVESASHSALQLLPKNGGKLEVSIAVRARWNAAVCATLPSTWVAKL